MFQLRDLAILIYALFNFVDVVLLSYWANTVEEIAGIGVIELIKSSPYLFFIGRSLGVVAVVALISKGCGPLGWAVIGISHLSMVLAHIMIMAL